MCGGLLTSAKTPPLPWEHAHMNISTSQEVPRETSDRTCTPGFDTGPWWSESVGGGSDAVIRSDEKINTRHET